MSHSVDHHSNIEQDTLLLDISTRDVISFSADDNLVGVAQVMAERRISSVVVLDENRHPIGIVTERNILQAMLSGCNPETALSGIMSSPVISVPASISVLNAYNICLKRSIRHIVIVDTDGLVAGVASETDFRQHLNLTALAGRRKVVSVAKRSMIAMPPTASLYQALGLMLNQHKSCVIVVEDRKPVGIVTERDAVRFYSGGDTDTSVTLSQVMTSPVLTIPGTSSCSQAAEEMLVRRVRHLVVVDESGLLMGLVSEHDLTQAMAGGLTEERGGIEESFLRTLINTLPDLVWLKDAEGFYLACNARFERFFGAKERDIVGKSDYDFVSRELADFFREHDRSAMEAGVPTVNEEWVTFADDGHSEFLETIKTPMHDRKGNLVGVLGIARDITMRKQLEKSLEQSERKLHNIYDSVGDCIEILSEDGRILEMNRIGYERLGYTREEMIGLKLSEFAAPEFAGEMAEVIPRVKRYGHATFESGRLRKDGSVIPLEVHTRLIRLDGQDVFLGISRDISNRKAAEQALQKLNEDLSATLQAIPDLLFDLDQDGRYHAVWAHDQELLAVQKGLLLGRTVAEMLPKESADVVMEALREAGEKGYSQGQIIRLEVPQGHRWFELSTAAKSSVEDAARRFIMLSRDVTDRMMAEAQLHDSHEKLSGLYKLSPMGIALTDMQGRYIEFNEAFRDICGYNREELNLLDYWELTPKEYEEKEAEQLASLNSKGFYGPYEKEYIRKNGSRIPLRLNGVLIHDNKGTPYIWSIVEDISERKRTEKELREKEERLALATLHNGVGIWDWNLVTQEMIWDDSMYALYRIRSEDFIGTEEAWRKSLHPEDLERGDRDVEDAIAGIRPFDTEFRVVWPNGEIRYIKAVAKVFRDESGKPLRMLGTNVDITERQRLEQQVRESEELFRAVFTQAPSAVELIDLDTLRFIEANPAACSMLGYTREEYLQLCLTDTQAKLQDEVELRAAILKIEEMDGLTFENSHRCKNGDILQVEISARILSISGKRLLVGVWRDITERKRAEELLRKQKEFSDDVINSLPGIFYILDNGGNFIRVNPQFEQVTGYTVAELENMSALSLFEDKGKEAISERIAKVFETGSSSVEAELVTKSGQRIPYYFTGHLTNIDGRAYLIGLGTDITERKEAEHKLQQSELHFRFVTESAQALIWMSGPDKRCTWFNKVWLDFTGRSLELELGDGWAEGVHPDDLQHCYEVYSGSFDHRESFTMEYRLRRHDGEYRWILDYGSPRINAQGVLEGYIGSCFDITERKRDEENLRVTASVFETAQEAILITDADNLIVDVNQAFARITGYCREEVLGRNPNLLSSGRQDKEFYAQMWRTLSEQGAWRGEVWNRRKSGEVYAELLSISVIRDKYGKILRYVGVFSDISYMKEHEEQLNRVAYYDGLTNIPNRLLLADRMKQAIAHAMREQQMIAVCYLDLDGFKPVNDTLGHDAGDRVLVEIARRLESSVRSGDTVARLGGDEFVVLLQGLDQADNYMIFLDRLLTAIAQPIKVEGTEANLGASIGVSIYPLDDEDPDALLRYADQAMYVAKQSGKNRFHIYDAKLDTQGSYKKEHQEKALGNKFLSTDKSTEKGVIRYEIDKDNIIRTVSPEWDEFARNNNAPHLVSEFVIGRPFLEYVDGEVTSLFVKAMLQSARSTNAPISLDFRCDSPDEKRFMNMTALPLPDGGVEFISKILHTERLQKSISFERPENPTQTTLVRCSMCNSVKKENNWLDVDELLNTSSVKSLHVVYEICPACQNNLAQSGHIDISHFVKPD